jgi:hypothetical protein
MLIIGWFRTNEQTRRTKFAERKRIQKNSNSNRPRVVSGIQMIVDAKDDVDARNDIILQLDDRWLALVTK